MVFQDIVTADIVKSNFSFDEQVLEILNLSEEFAKTINLLEKDGDKNNQYANISYTSEQYVESIFYFNF